MEISDETISAFLDGELTADEMAVLKSAIEGNPELGRKVEKIGAVDRVVNTAYSEITSEPVPDSVLALLKPQSVPTGIFATIASRITSISTQYRHWPVALAASIALVIGLGVGNLFTSNSGSNLPSTMLVAGILSEDDPISKVLETGLSAETVTIEGNRPVAVTPVLTFRSSAGNYCREFKVASGERGNRAIACRDDTRWAIEMVVTDVSANPTPNTYTTASGGVVEAFDNFVNALIAGAPLAVDEETALIEQEWRR